MRIVSLMFVVIAIFLATFFYLKSTQNSLSENLNSETKKDTRIEYAKEVVEEFNKSTAAQKKELDNILDK